MGSRTSHIAAGQFRSAVVVADLPLDDKKFSRSNADPHDHPLPVLERAPSSSFASAASGSNTASSAPPSWTASG
jgi:hypothetical protein